MLKKLTKKVSRLRSLVRKFPPLRRLDDRITLNRRFLVEKALIKGTHQNNNPHPSILHFTVAKCATRHVMGVLKQCACACGMTHVNLNSYIFDTSIPFLDKMSAEEFAKYRHVFKPNGYLYSTLGGMSEGIPDLGEYKIVLMLRDPRDVLVSNYYSIAYSHGLPIEGSMRHDGFVQERMRAREMSLDDYACDQSSWVKGVYERYYNLLVKKYPPSFYYYTSYEAMVGDYPRWLKDLLAYLELDVPTSLVDALIDKNERSRPAQEDIYKHRRLGRSGDYLEKISPKTISYLNEDLKEMLSVFGYSEKEPAQGKFLG
ncbi:MAG TPA: sulfotransferase domain-containing protein [Anaerolineales bacterium]|nr:sulfotransferase domain-containing protein [Anaerolineales bacterium]